MAKSSNYARILRPARLGFQAPHDVSAFVVVERLKGNSTTDFGDYMIRSRRFPIFRQQRTTLRG